MLRIILKTFVYIALVGAISISSSVVYSLITNPCDLPITLYVDQFDSRFPITKSELYKALTDAVYAWENSSNRDLFTISDVPNSDAVKLSMIYDERQATSERLEELGNELVVERGTYDSLISEYDRQKAEYDRLVAEYDQEIQNGGQGREIDNKRLRINSLAESLNNLVVQINNQAQSTNFVVDQYNDKNNSLGAEYDQAIYESDGNSETITIYKFSNKSDLRDVLIHELGHALGLDHSDSEESVMYYLNTEVDQSILKSDLSSLSRVCKLD